jgi:hypothetical protein
MPENDNGPESGLVEWGVFPAIAIQIGTQVVAIPDDAAVDVYLALGEQLVERGLLKE